MEFSFSAAEIIEIVQAASSRGTTTEITRGIDEGDWKFFHSFVTWEENFQKHLDKTSEKK